MPTVRMHTRIEGWRNGKRWPEAGGLIEVSPGEVDGLVSSGYAELVEDEPAPALPKPETAAARKPATRKR